MSCWALLNFLGPTQISSCGHLTLDGSQSTGGGGRNLKYVWSLEGLVNADITAVLDAAENKDRVSINGTLMAAGSSYTFKLSKFFETRTFRHESKEGFKL